MAATASLLLFGRITLGLVFILSGLTKLPNVAGFADAVAAFRLLPMHMVTPFARAVVVAELGIGVLLLLGIAVEVALVGLLLLLTLFSIALVQALRQGQVLMCQCFGQISRRPVSWGAVLRNLLLAGLGLVTLGGLWRGGSAPVSGAEIVGAGLLSLGVIALAAVAAEAAPLLRRQSN